MSQISSKGNVEMSPLPINFKTSMVSSHIPLRKRILIVLGVKSGCHEHCKPNENHSMK